MSEQAKAAFLQEKIKDTKSNVKIGALSIISGSVFIAIGIVLSVWIGIIFVIAVVIVGTFLLIYGLYVGVHFSQIRQVNERLRKNDYLNLCLS